MPKFKDYLKGPNGNPSSTRLFSSYFMWYFFVINILIMLSFGNHYAKYARINDDKLPEWYKD